MNTCQVNFQMRYRHILAIAAALFMIVISGVVAAGGGKTLKPVTSMHEMRASHTATLLPNGKVLIAGGFKKVHTYEQVYFNSAELYDPKTRTFTPTGKLNVARCGHTATLLPDGTVLIVGGGSDQPLASAELYDPRRETFVPVGMMASPRQGHTATLLKNGNVLISGGRTDGHTESEIFNVRVKRFEPAGNLTVNRSGHTATLLPDGKVLIAGGAALNGNKHKVLSSAELYDPATDKCTPAGEMTMVRYKHAAILLPDTTVLIVGGSDEVVLHLNRRAAAMQNELEAHLSLEGVNKKSAKDTREETARTTFIHFGIIVAVAGIRRAMARQENEYRLTSISPS